MNIIKTLLVTAFYRSGTIARIRKAIPGKMKCGLTFQHLPESIHMVRHYEIITERCRPNLSKLIKNAKWAYK